MSMAPATPRRQAPRIAHHRFALNGDNIVLRWRLALGAALLAACVSASPAFVPQPNFHDRVAAAHPAAARGSLVATQRMAAGTEPEHEGAHARGGAVWRPPEGYVPRGKPPQGNRDQYAATPAAVPGSGQDEGGGGAREGGGIRALRADGRYPVGYWPKRPRCGGQVRGSVPEPAGAAEGGRACVALGKGAHWDCWGDTKHAGAPADVCVSIYRSIDLSMFLSVFIHLSIFLSVFIHLSICLSVYILYI